MALQSILDYAHLLMKQVISEGDIVIDGTCGNGHDTLFLSQQVKKNGFVYGFDIQEKAIIKTKQRLTEYGNINNVSLINDSHARIETYIPSHTPVQAAIFNLGYLPGSDKAIITTPSETIASLESILQMLNKGGRIVLVVYYGHKGGTEEKDELLKYVQSLEQESYRVLQYGFINQRNNPPFILAIEKTKA